MLVHEWGHFIVAKWCKMRVDDFSLFFGKVLFSLGVRNGTSITFAAFRSAGLSKSQAWSRMMSPMALLCFGAIPSGKSSRRICAA